MNPNKENDRYLTFLELMQEVEKSFDFISAYSSIPRVYNDKLLYSAETHTIRVIAENEGITISELAQIQEKTKSASSQMVKNLVKKGLVVQESKPTNKKEKYLSLTDEGLDIYNQHEKIDHKSFLKAYERVMPKDSESMKIFIEIQQKLNESFYEDLEQNQKEYEEYLNKIKS